MRMRWGIAVVLFCIAVVVLRVFLSSRGEYRAAEQALARGDMDEAIVKLRRTARWYLPGDPMVGRALARLEELAQRAEAAGGARLARKAWEAERSALLETRSFYTPHPERLAVANQHIAALLAAEEQQEEEGAKTSATERAAWHLGLLERDDAPKVSWTLLALLGFVSYLAGAFLFIFRGVTHDDTLRPRVAFVAALVVVLGFSMFLIGLTRA